MILKVKGQSLKLEGAVVAEGAVNFATFEIKTDKAWEGLTKTVRFCRVGERKIYDVADVREGEVYYLPRELLLEGKVEASVVGVNGEGIVATTEKKRFTVKGSVDGGNTPKTSPDAYAKYVSDVLYLKERCESAEKEAKEAEAISLRVCEEVEKKASETNKILLECRDILANVSGAFDAVAVALREIKESERALVGKKSELDFLEDKRDTSERARALAEREREKREEERREAESERRALESARSTAEKLRVLREETILNEMKDVRERIESLEKSEPFFFIEGEESEEYILSDATLENKATGEVLYLPSPLLKLGEASDSIEIDEEETKVVRRALSVYLHGDEEIIEDGNLFAIPLDLSGIGELTGRSSRLIYGEEIYVKGELLFFTSFDTSDALRSFLRENAPFEVVYPLSKEKVQTLPSMTLPKGSTGVEINADGKATVFYKKSLKDTLSEIREKIKGEKI